MGWIASFLSKAVVTGFLAGAAVDVVIGELPKLTGTSADGDNPGASSGRGWAPSAMCTRRRCSSAPPRSPPAGSCSGPCGPRPAVLGAPQGRARGRDHRRRRVRHDRRRRVAAPVPDDALRLLGRGGGDRRRPLGGRARRRRDRRRPLARLAHLRRDDDRRCRCSAASPGPRSTATSTRTRATRRSPASPSCASTAASSSPPPRRSRIASARWRRTAIARARSCSISRASTSWTPRARPRWLRSASSRTRRRSR